MSWPTGIFRAAGLGNETDVPEDRRAVVRGSRPSMATCRRGCIRPAGSGSGWFFRPR